MDTMTARRSCSWLACPNWYDAIAGTTATGWQRWNTLGLRLCPDHSHVWLGGAHMPSLDTTDPDRPPVMRCGCGWDLDTLGLNAGHVADGYLQHLAADATPAQVQP